MSCSMGEEAIRMKLKNCEMQKIGGNKNEFNRTDGIIKEKKRSKSGR